MVKSKPKFSLKKKKFFFFQIFGSTSTTDITDNNEMRSINKKCNSYSLMLQFKYFFLVSIVIDTFILNDKIIYYR